MNTYSKHWDHPVNTHAYAAKVKPNLCINLSRFGPVITCRTTLLIQGLFLCGKPDEFAE